MPIHYLNGRRLKNAIIAGAESVITRAEYLNKINVFPVADGDTGTNMALTLKSVAEGLYECDDSTVGTVVTCAADAALVGSRGNSGSILAQFYQGLSEGLSGKERISTKDFGEAIMLSKQLAYESMIDPKEGTILTVIRDWSHSVHSLGKNQACFREVMHHSVEEAKRALARTPDQLTVNGVAILKKAGVVDSGAQGFVDMVEGVVNFMNKGSMKDFFKRKFFAVSSEEGASVDTNSEAITFQFCTEFVLENGSSFDKKKLRKELLDFGDSLIIGGSSTKTKVHIHTNEPQSVFTMAGKYGTVVKTKYEDMKAQHEAAFGKKKIGIVTDSTCDLSDEFLEKHDVRMVPLQVRFGTEEYLDRVTINSDEFYAKLKAAKELPKSSQPSTANFKQVYEDALRQYESLLVVSVSSGVSGTYQNARTTSKFFKDKKFAIVDSKGASMMLGFLVREAVALRDEGAPIEAIEKRLHELSKKIKAFLALETIDNLVRGGRLSKSRGLIAKLLKINPVLTFDSHGKVVQLAKGIGNRGALDKAVELALSEIEGKKYAKVSIVYSDNRERAEYAKEKMKAARPDVEPELTVISPVLGTYGGSGTVVIITCSE
ncbi:MAG: DegV family protein [Chloroherpetonaceae bacterium]|nr:DegV family protein [Chloroherpetonaceae bacterium]